LLWGDSNVKAKLHFAWPENLCVKSFLFIGHLIFCFSFNLGIKDPNKIFIHFSYIVYNLKSMNSSVHEHFHHRKIFCPDEIK